MTNTHPHFHIDSSGAFECPMGSACKLPDAGKQFDAALTGLRLAVSVLKDSAFNAVVREEIRKALATLEGKVPK